MINTIIVDENGGYKLPSPLVAANNGSFNFEFRFQNGQLFKLQTRATGSRLEKMVQKIAATAIPVKQSKPTTRPRGNVAQVIQDLFLEQGYKDARLLFDMSKSKKLLLLPVPDDNYPETIAEIRHKTPDGEFFLVKNLCIEDNEFFWVCSLTRLMVPGWDKAIPGWRKPVKFQILAEARRYPPILNDQVIKARRVVKKKNAASN